MKAMKRHGERTFQGRGVRTAGIKVLNADIKVKSV